MPPAAASSSVALPAREDDCGDIDLHVCDKIRAAVDFDDVGNELDYDGPVSDDVSLAGFRVFGFVGASGVSALISKPLSLQPLSLYTNETLSLHSITRNLFAFRRTDWRSKPTTLRPATSFGSPFCGS